MERAYTSTERLGEVIREISPNDVMYASGDPESYFKWGEEAVRLVEGAALLAGGHEIRRILDLPCGHGRVLRTLKASFPDAEITACDIDRDSVDFCAATFGAIPVYSRHDPNELDLTGFDLIWCGSLLTHLSAARWSSFLRFFEGALSHGGILVFTTNGRRVAEWSRNGDLLQIVQDPTRLPAILDDYDASGFGYRDYPEQQGQGVSMSLPEWVCATIRKETTLRLVSYTEAGWFGAQDAVACTKLPAGGDIWTA